MIYTITLNPAIDKIKYLENDLSREQNNRVRENILDLGGKATHVSAILQQLNEPNIALGYAGEINKKELDEVLKKYKVSHDFIKVKNESVRETIVVINNSGGSYMITEKGPFISQMYKNSLYEFLEENIKDEDIVVIAGSPPPNYTKEDYRQLLKILKKKNIFIACDVAGEYLTVSLEEEVSFVKPNEHELIQLFPETEGLLEKFIKLTAKVEDAVCTLGEAGAMYMTDRNLYKIEPPKVKVLSDTGAGDSFVGGYIYGVNRNYSVHERVKHGLIVSASKVQHHGSCQINQSQFKLIEDNIKTIEVR